MRSPLAFISIVFSEAIASGILPDAAGLERAVRAIHDEFFP